jgi:hypothetical protein
MREASAERAAEATSPVPARERRVLGGSGGLTPDVVSRLQKSAGNAAVTALIQRETSTPPKAPATRAAAPRRAIQRGFWGRLWRGVKKVASKAWSGAKGAASWVYEGAKKVGSHVVDWVKKAGSKVVDAIKWFGDKAWDVIKVIGTIAWEKLSLLGTLAWTFVSNLPVRVWRLVIDGWEAIVGVLGWTWDGLKGAAGAAWDAAVGVYSWLKEGVDGALGWLWKGLKDGASWAVEFAKKPSLGKLWDGLLGTLSWLGKGAKGLGRWGWRGVAAAAKWAWSGLKGLGSWLWDGFKGGAKWAGEVFIHLLDLGVGDALQLVWGLIFRMRPLTAAERQASESVHPKGLIPYWKVRVDENSYLIKLGQKLAKLFKTKTSPAAITTMHVIHSPSVMSLPLAVHELTHVAQYEKVGAMYMPQALHGQGSSMGYSYGNLTMALRNGKRFKDFNREQQASICEDYYKVMNGMPADYGGTKGELRPFIGDMRAGKF